MLGTTVRGAGSAVGHIDPTWRTPERRGCPSAGTRQEQTVLEVSQRLLASAGCVIWFSYASYPFLLCKAVLTACTK
jgi:hypothetical protein